MKNFKHLILASFSLLCCMFATNVQAQFDCDCPEPVEGEYVCASDSTEQFIIALPNECWAECFGLFVVEGECDNPGWEWEDCDCGDEYDPVCVMDENGYIFEEYNQCYADCYGYLPAEGCDDNPWEDCDCEYDWNDEGICFLYISATGDTITEWAPSVCWAECWVEGEVTIVDCNWDNPWEDCDCDETDEQFICVLTDATTGVICVFPNLCFAECAGYGENDIVDCEGLEGFECLECGAEDYNPVCVVDSTGYVFEVPNQCFADCLGFTVTDEDCSFIDPCDCEIDPEDEGICVTVDYGDGFEFTEWIPNECFITCFFGDSLDYTIVDCDDNWGNGEDCICPSIYDPVCVIDSLGNIFEVSNECWAECLGLEIVDADCSYVDPCNCEIDPEDAGLCISVDYGDGFVYTEWVPNECFLECYYAGLDYAIIDCDDNGGWNGEQDSTWAMLDSCIQNIIFDENTLIQTVILSLGDCGLELSECVLNAPLFATDEEFIDYIVANCEDIFNGFTGNEGLNNLMARMNEENSTNNPTSTKDLVSDIYKVTLLGNPVSTELNYKVNSTVQGNASISLTDMYGRIISTEVVNVQIGDNYYRSDVSNLTNNIYFINIILENNNTSSKFVVIK